MSPTRDSIFKSMAATLTRWLVPPYSRERPPTKSVAILVLLSLRPKLEPDEWISLRHLVHYLGNYDRFLIAPRGSGLRLDGFETRHIPRRYFGSAAAMNHLLLGPMIYRLFEDYRYICIYHLDALVFSDQMERWCESGLDYIGAPWIRCDDTPAVTRERVGNTGFGMLKVESALKVLHNRHRMEPATYWLDLLTRHSERMKPVVSLLRTLQRAFPRSEALGRLVREWDEMRDPGSHNRNDDQFWSDKAVKYLPEYRIASVEEGLQFSFEVAPRVCFERSGGRMPFGCHAWQRYDRSFWEPHLLPPADPGFA